MGFIFLSGFVSNYLKCFKGLFQTTTAFITVVMSRNSSVMNEINLSCKAALHCTLTIVPLLSSI